MKTSLFRSARKRGSALITVIFLVFMMGLLTTSMLRYSGAEQRMNERQRMILRTRNMTENVAIYASEQITNKLYKLRSTEKRWFTGSNDISLPPDDVLTTQYSIPSNVEVRAGLTETFPLRFIDPALPENEDNEYKGLQIENSVVPIIAKATMTHPALGPITTYAQQDLEVAMLPLFQFAIFYNMDLEFGPGPAMTIAGPVHTNGDLIARNQTGQNAILRFTERVSTAKGFYANTGHKGSTFFGSGSEDDGPGSNAGLFFHRAGSPKDETGVNIQSSSGVWRDHKWATYPDVDPRSVAETDNSRKLFMNFATATYNGNLRTKVHGVPELELPAMADGRELVAEPVQGEKGAVLGTKFSRNTGLYIIVNPDSQTRNGHLPRGSGETIAVPMRARSYRAFLCTVLDPGESYDIVEVVLPGQPSYGDMNAFANTLPNAYRTDTSVGSNQVLRTIQGNGAGFVDFPGTGYPWAGALPDFDGSATHAEVMTQDAYFFDLRRGYNASGMPMSRSAALRFRPRPLVKIDFDMTRFRMAVERTLWDGVRSNVYNPARPNNDTWASSIFNYAANRANHGLGLHTPTELTFEEFPTRDIVPAVVRSQAAAFAPQSITIGNKTGVTGDGNDYATSAIRIRTTANAAQSDANGTFGNWDAAVTWLAGPNQTYTPGANVRAIEITQYLAGSPLSASTVMLDQQVIPIIRAGDTAVRVSLTNDRYIVPWNGNPLLTNTPAPSAYARAVTEMRVFVGDVDDTANWTFDVETVPAGVTGTIGTTPLSTTATVRGHGRHANRLKIDSMLTTAGVANSTATIRIVATKPAWNGAITRWVKEFQLVKKPDAAGLANGTGAWLTISGGVSPDPFRIYRAPTTAAQVAAAVADPTPYLLHESSFADAYGGKVPWFDGITVYIESVGANNRNVSGTGNNIITDRIASGVRLWNGRGPVISLPSDFVRANPGKNTPEKDGPISPDFKGMTGFSFATNDAAYIVGHFNADGVTIADRNAPPNENGYQGYSGVYPDSAEEKLTAVMADAITILSQPTMTRAGASPNYTYYQTSGWSDSMSAQAREWTGAGQYSADWQFTNPGSTNQIDGIRIQFQPSLMPNLTVPSAILETADTSTTARPGPRAAVSGLAGNYAPARQQWKFDPGFVLPNGTIAGTEISSCLLTGIVSTTVRAGGVSGQSSGGAHNFPRLLENWSINHPDRDPRFTVPLFIRGSMIAMFESEVAVEPWTIRVYQGAGREWGLHNSLRGENGEHDVPLEPIVLGATRMSYRELTKDEYDKMKKTIEDLPAPAAVIE